MVCVRVRAHAKAKVITEALPASSVAREPLYLLVALHFTAVPTLPRAHSMDRVSGSAGLLRSTAPGQPLIQLRVIES